MKLYIKYHINTICKKILQEQLEKIGLSYAILGYTEIEIKEDVSNDKLRKLHAELNNYGIEIVESSKNILVQKIKDAIIEMVYLEDRLPISKISSHLADKLTHSYGYLSNVFAEVTYTSIENFIILHRIELAKKLITVDELSFTEIAHKLNYSSLAHFCTQFKNTTGLTPSAFKRIIIKRRETAMNNI
jgi:AraC-like DNA-binding protein